MARVLFKGIQGPGGMVIPKETLVYYATQIPVLRSEVIAVLLAEGHLEAAGVKPPSWPVRLWRRLFTRERPALTQGA